MVVFCGNSVALLFAPVGVSKGFAENFAENIRNTLLISKFYLKTLGEEILCVSL